MNILSFRGAAAEVIYMNSLFRKEHAHLDTTMINNQKGYTLSEMEELLVAIKNNDAKEFVDAIGDIFVTASYLAFLLCKNADEFYELISQETVLSMDDFLIDNKLFAENYEKLLLAIYEHNKEDIIFCLARMLHLLDMDWVSYKGMSNSERAIHNINLSNLSKFPHKNEKTNEDIQKDIQHIKNYLLNKGEGDVNISHLIYKDRITYFREDTKKFLKPMTFVEPDLMWVNQNPYLRQLVSNLFNYSLVNPIVDMDNVSNLVNK